MGYKFRSSGLSGMDLLITTKKGIEEGGLPKGIIIPIGYKHRPEVMSVINDPQYCVYVAKHCDDENVLTHIQANGIVNRFGWFVTKSEILSVKKEWTLDVGCSSWFKRVNVKNISYVEDFFKEKKRIPKMKKSDMEALSNEELNVIAQEKNSKNLPTEMAKTAQKIIWDRRIQPENRVVDEYSGKADVNDERYQNAQDFQTFVDYLQGGK